MATFFASLQVTPLLVGLPWKLPAMSSYFLLPQTVLNNLDSHNLTLTEAVRIARSGGCWLYVVLHTLSSAGQKWWWRWWWDRFPVHGYTCQPFSSRRSICPSKFSLLTLTVSERGCNNYLQYFEVLVGDRKGIWPVKCLAEAMAEDFTKEPIRNM